MIENNVDFTKNQRTSSCIEGIILRYYDGTTDITGSFTGDAKEEKAGEWELTLSQGGNKITL